MVDIFEGICGLIMLGVMIWVFCSLTSSTFPASSKNNGQKDNKENNNSTSGPKPEEKYDDYTDGIDETSNASFTDVVKEVVSDITGKSFENTDDPINDDDDDDPIKFK